MIMLLPLLASIADRISALSNLRKTHAALEPLLDRIARWLMSDGFSEREPADDLRHAIAELRPNLDADASWDQIVLANLLIRLRDLVDVSSDCRALERAIAEGSDPALMKLAFEPEAGVVLSRHRDQLLALWSAAGAVAAILFCCALWIATGWTDGASAPMMAAVGCSFFAAQDDPAKGIRGFGWWSLVAVIVVGIYLFAIVPAITDIEVLIAALAPTYLLFGFLIARPATSFIGMALAANSSTLLALQSTYAADFQSYANSSIAFLIGMAMAAVVTRLARAVGAEWIAQRLMKTSWTTLAVTAERRGMNDRAAFAGLMLDRLGLLTQRIAAIDEADRSDVANLSLLRVGHQYHRFAPRPPVACAFDPSGHRRYVDGTCGRCPQPCGRRRAAASNCWSGSIGRSREPSKSLPENPGRCVDRHHRHPARPVPSRGRLRRRTGRRKESSWHEA